MRGPVTAALAGLAVLAGACGDGGENGYPAGSVPSAELSGECGGWMGAGVLAIVCDSTQANAAAFSISTREKEVDSPPEVPMGIAQMMGDPLEDGERIDFVLEGGSAETVAAFRTVGDGRTEQVVIAPFDPPAHRYGVEIDGRVARVSTDTGSERVIQIGEPAPDVDVRDGTPAEAIRSFIALTNHGEVGWRPACELLAEETRAAYERGEWPCESLLGLTLTYDEYGEYPEPQRSELGAVSLRKGSDPTIAVVELTHHYRPDRPGQPTKNRATALVPVSEEDGHWRILLPHTLSPIAALRGDTAPSEAELRARLAELDD